MTPPLQILFEDNHCLAVAKPAPLLTQAPAQVPSLEGRVKAYLKERYHKAGNVYLGVPHRLDRPVSGVVLFARNSKSATRLAEQFQNRTVTKIYWAAVEGVLTPTDGEWENWLRKLQAESRSEVAEPNAEGAKFARLSYRVLGPCAGGSLVEFHLETGRMHQIRLQAASRGWPIQGDMLYGSRVPFGPNAELPRDRIIALHGRSLTFQHPLSYEAMTLTAPLPAAWEGLGVALQ